MNVAQEVSDLRPMSVEQLRKKYAEVFGSETTARHRIWLMRKIAWQVQSLREGGLSERARQRAEELARDVELRIVRQRMKCVAEPGAAIGTRLEKRDDRLPPPGTLLTRAYKGRTVAVRVLDEAFEYEGEAYPSLSAVAAAITGSHLNGYQFFQLGGRR